LPVRSIPKVDAATPREAGESNDLVEQYEHLRASALAEGAGGAGLGLALLSSKGMAAWMRGWRACAPLAPRLAAPRAAVGGRGSEVVSVLAAMALVCAGEG
jgi:hypothetical protein